MNRRGFLQRVGLGASAALIAPTVLASAQPYPDRFTYRGYNVRWADWRAPVNQTIVFGVWVAFPVDRHAKPPIGHYQVGHTSTTLGGYAGRANELDCIDMTYKRGDWPSPQFDVPYMTPEQRDALKQRACRALLEHL